MEYKMDPLEYAVMVGVRALSLVAREQLGPAATPEAVAERYIALRQRAYDNLKSEPNPSADEVVATRVLILKSEPNPSADEVVATRVLMQALKRGDQRNSMEADERLRAVRKLLEENGCECPCDHHPDERGPDCEVCLACRIGEAVGK